MNKLDTLDKSITIFCVGMIFIGLIAFGVGIYEHFYQDPVLEWMEENNIKIYGTAACYWCEKQVEDLGRDEVEKRNLFVECSVNQRWICPDITSTPAWKRADELIHTGYIPPGKIMETLK